MGALLVVTGPPGAGKSTVAALVADRFDPGVLVEGDAFFAFLRRGASPPWLPGSERQNVIVTEAAAMATGHYAAGGYTTVYDGVVGPWNLPLFAAASGLERLHYVMLLPPADVCVARVASRIGHGFSDESGTRKMHDEFARASIADRHVLTDPSERPEAVADLVVARFHEGRFEYRGNNVPPPAEWAGGS